MNEPPTLAVDLPNSNLQMLVNQTVKFVEAVLNVELNSSSMHGDGFKIVTAISLITCTFMSFMASFCLHVHQSLKL